MSKLHTIEEAFEEFESDPEYVAYGIELEEKMKGMSKAERRDFILSLVQVELIQLKGDV